MHPPSSILLIAAMEQEVRPLVERLGFVPLQKPETSKLPFARYECELKGTRIVLSLNGKDRRYGNENVGLEVAALNTYDSIHRFNPDMVINLGTAGSFDDPHAEVGKVFLSKNKFFFHDHRIPLVGYEDYGRGHLPGWDTEALATLLSLPTATISSGSSLDFTEQDLMELKNSGATLKEMEASAIAWACFLTEKPFFAIKSITNVIARDVSSASEFEKNFEVAVHSLTRTTALVLETVVEGKWGYSKGE